MSRNRRTVAPRSNELDVRRVLVQRAIPSFAQHGLGGCRLIDISKDIHVSSPLLLYHFESIENFFDEALLELVNEEQRFFERQQLLSVISVDDLLEEWTDQLFSWRQSQSWISALTLHIPSRLMFCNKLSQRFHELRQFHGQRLQAALLKISSSHKLQESHLSAISDFEWGSRLCQFQFAELESQLIRKRNFVRTCKSMLG